MTSISRLTLAVASLSLIHCIVDLKLPGGEPISCETPSECPTGFDCRAGLCVDTSANQAPTLSIGDIARSFGEITIPLTAVDANLDPVSIFFELDLGDGFFPIDVESPTIVDTSGSMVQSLSWDPGDVLDPLMYTQDIQLRATPSDPETAGESALSSRFSYGNDAPIVESILVEAPNAQVSGSTIVSILLSDSAGDPAMISALDLVLLGSADVIPLPLPGDAEHSLHFPAGLFNGLNTQSGEPFFIVWNSQIAAPENVEGASLRVTVTDDATSAPASSQSFAIQNQQAPRAQLIGIKSGDVLSGIIPIRYRLIDEESDPTDILIEIQQRGQWFPATEFPAPLSEGSAHLGTRPENEQGLEHIFYWDSDADMPVARETALRMTVSDGKSEVPRPQLLASGIVVGPPSLAPTGSAFSKSSQYSATGIERPMFPVVADFNEDGALDVIAPDTDSNAGSPYEMNQWQGVLDGEGRPDGSFIESLSGDWDSGCGIPTGTVPRGILTLDVDDDNHHDILISCGTSLLVHEGTGTGTFAAPNAFALSAAAGQMSAVDVNQDGIADILMASHGGDFIVLLAEADVLGPTGNFIEAHVYSGGTGFGGIDWGDFDGDGFVDVARANSLSNDVSVFLGNGDGSFEEATLSPYDGCLGTRDVATGDIDGDGLADLVALCELTTNDAMWLRRGEDSGLVLAEPEYFDLPTGADQVYIEDFDGNDLLDIGVMNRGTDFLLLHYNLQSTGFFSSLQAYPAGNQPVGLALADFNGDRHVDWLTATRSDETLSVHLFQKTTQVGDASLGAASQLFGSNDPFIILSEDLNWNQRDDLVVSRRDGVDVYIENTDSLLPSASWGLSQSIEIVDLSSLVLGDINGDGALDLVAAAERSSDSSDGTSVYVMLGSISDGVPTGRFTSVQELDLSPLQNISILALGHFNDDLNLDVAAYRYNTSSGNILLGDGEGSFAEGGNFDTSGLSNSWDLNVADLNRDGLNDLIFASGSEASWVLATSISPPTFASMQSAGTANNGRSVIPKDLDNDGDLDLFYGSGTSGDELKTLLNNGDATFVDGSAQSGCRVGPIPAAFDFNRDGAQDLVLPCPASGGLSFALNQSRADVGTGIFEAVVSYADGVLSSSGNRGATSFGDYNGDHHMDISYTDAIGDVVLTYLSQSESHFEAGSEALLSALNVSSAMAGVTQTEFGASPQRIVKRLFTGRGDAYTQSIGAELRRGASFQRLAENEGVLAGVVVQPVTHSWFVSGFVRLSRVPGPEGEGSRLRVEARLGTEVNSDTGEYAPADLNAIDFAAQRGVYLNIPIRPALVSAINAGATLRVVGATLDWLRSSELAGDLINESSLLPQIDGRDVLRPQYHFSEIPRASADNFEGGVGARFAVAAGTAAELEIRILIEQDGIYQAFIDE